MSDRVSRFGRKVYDMKRVLILVLLIVFSCECPALVTWKNSVGDWDVAKTANWSGTDNQWKMNVAGHYFLLSDWTLDGMILDEGTLGKVYYFDFAADRTLTIQGKSRHAIATNGAKNQRLDITGGTVLITEENWKAGTDNLALIAPQRQSSNAAGENIVIAAYNRDATSNVRIKTPMIRVGWGKDNWFVASNKAEVTVGVCDVGAYGPGNGNGILVDSGATMTFTNETTLLIGAASTSTSNKFIVSNGGKISGCQRFEIKGGVGNLLAFRGAGTDVTFSGASAKSVFEGSGLTLEVSEGAKFTMEGVQGRVWMGTASGHAGNTIAVSGEGSVFRAKGTGFLVGQNAARNQRVIVSDGARAEFASIHVGHGGQAAAPVCDNLLRVEHGVVVDSGATYVGGANGAGTGNEYSSGNRLEIVGGIVSNAALYVGYFAQSKSNSVDIAGGCLRSTGDVFCNFSGTGSAVTVRDGGELDVGGSFFAGLHDQNSTASGSDARVEVLSGGSLCAASHVMFHGTNGTLVVSNGVVEAGGEIQLPYYFAPDRGMRVVLAGTNPVIRSSAAYVKTAYAFGTRYDTQFHFVVPQGGFVEAPLQTAEGRLGIFNTETDTPFTFDFSACDLQQPFETVLASAQGEGELYVADGMLDKINAAIPSEGGRKVAKVRRVGNELRLLVGFKGLAIIVR